VVKRTFSNLFTATTIGWHRSGHSDEIFFVDDLVLPLFAPILLNLPGDIDKNDPTEPGPFKREIRAIGPQFSAKTVQLGRSFQENVSFLE
jgi:hypothetical protein